MAHAPVPSSPRPMGWEPPVSKNVIMFRSSTRSGFYSNNFLGKSLYKNLTGLSCI